MILYFVFFVYFKVPHYCFLYFIVHPVRLSLVFIKGYLLTYLLTYNSDHVYSSL